MTTIGRGLTAIGVLSCLSIGTAHAGAPGMGSQPNNRPSYIELGPKPDHPERYLRRTFQADKRCAANRRLFVANVAQNYALEVRLSRGRISHSDRRVVQRVLEPLGPPVGVGCAAGQSSPARWQLDSAQFVATDRQGP